MFELLYWRQNYRKFHGKPVPISSESWAFYLIISSIRLNMSSFIVCRKLASNYQANNHYNRAGAKYPIFLVMKKVSDLIALFRNCRLAAKRFKTFINAKSELCYEVDKPDSNKQQTSSFCVIVHHIKNKSQGSDMVESIVRLLAQTNENLTWNVLKRILTANKILYFLVISEYSFSTFIYLVTFVNISSDWLRYCLLHSLYNIILRLASF